MRYTNPRLLYFTLIKKELCITELGVFINLRIYGKFLGHGPESLLVISCRIPLLSVF